jgi:catechol 2,3-dioxygenase-like lactoylglutathione lyase family enzyme
MTTTAREVRFAFTFDDYDQALTLFRDVLGLEVMDTFDHQGGRGVIMRVPSATLELFDHEHALMVDDIEIGASQGGGPRIAIAVDDITVTGAALQATGVSPVGDTVDTPWGDRNRRYEMTGGLQLTLFQPIP